MTMTRQKAVETLRAHLPELIRRIYSESMAEELIAAIDVLAQAPAPDREVSDAIKVRAYVAGCAAYTDELAGSSSSNGAVCAFADAFLTEVRND